MGRLTFRNQGMCGRELGMLGIIRERLCDKVFEEE